MRHTVVALTAVLIACCLLSGCSGPEARKAEFYQKGKALYEKGELAKARLELKNAVQIDPKFSDAQRLLGLVEMKRGSFNAAFAAFSRAVEVNPADLEAQLQLGKLFLMQGAVEKATEKAVLVLRARPADEEALLLQGAIHLSQRRLDRAIALAGDMLHNGCTRPDVYLLLALAQHLNKDETGAEQTLRSGVARNGSNTSLHRALAELLAGRGDVAAAAAELQALIRLEPGNYGYSITLAGLQWQTGRQGEARALLDRLLKSGEVHEEVFRDVAVFYGKRELYRDAEQVLQQGLARHQGSCELRLFLSDVYLRSGRPESAAELLKKALERERGSKRPQALALKNALAAIQLGRGDTAEAGRLAGEVLGDSPRNPEANLIKGRLSLLQGQGTAAVTAFRTVVTDRPNDLEGYFLLSEALMLNREMDLALETLRQAQKVAPASQEVRLALARYHLRKQDFPGAERELRTALAGSPDDPTILNGLGDFYLAAGDRGRAEKFYGQLARTRPGAALARAKLSSLYASGGDPDRAASELATAVESAPGSDSLFERLVQLYVRQGKLSEAAAACRKRVAAQPANVIAYLALGQVLARQGEFVKGEQAILQADRLSGGSTRSSLALAQLRVLAGQPAKARLLFESIVVRDPGSLEAANDLACLLADYGTGRQDLDKALTLARRVAERRPQDPVVMDTLGWIYYRKGDYPQAVTLLQRAAVQLPTVGVVRYHAGMAQCRVGNRGQAREHLAAAVRSPDSYLGKDEAVQTLKTLR